MAPTASPSLADNRIDHSNHQKPFASTPKALLFDLSLDYNPSTSQSSSHLQESPAPTALTIAQHSVAANNNKQLNGRLSGTRMQTEQHDSGHNLLVLLSDWSPTESSSISAAMTTTLSERLETTTAAPVFSREEECQSQSHHGTNLPQSLNCSTQITYNSMRFCPEELNFADIEEVWLRKSWNEILSRVAFVAPIVLLGILGNLTIIYSMYKFKPFRSKPTNIFILNMAIADLLTTIVCPNAALFTDIYQFYVLGSFICRFEGFVKITCLLVSSYSLIVLSSDWLLCVVKPCRTRMSIRQSWITLATIWIVSVLMASPLFVWRRLRERQWKDLVEVWCCELIEYTKYYWVGITLFLIYLPTFFMTIVLVIILLQMDKFEAKLRRSRTSQQSVSSISGNHIQNNNSNNPLSISMRHRRRIVKILFSYLLTSIICWTPLQFTIVYRHFRSEAVPSPWFFQLTFYSQLSASLSAATNPIIFGFLSQPFRRIVARSFMFKFIDKLTTNTTVQRNTRQSDAANKNANALAMNQMNLNRNSNTRQTFRSQNARQLATHDKHDHITTFRANTSSHHNLNVTSFTTSTNNTNNHNKRVSFNTSASSVSRPNRDLGRENAGYEPIDKDNP